MKRNTKNQQSLSQQYRSQQDLAPYEELLIASIAANVGDAGNARLIAAVSHRELNWAQLLLAAVQHGVVGALDAALRQNCLENRMPAQIRDILRRIMEAQRLRNQEMFAALYSVMAACERKGVAALALKGPVLSIEVYPDHAIRTFSDLDILVLEEQWDLAGRAACAVDFYPLYAEVTPKDYNREFMRDTSEDILTATLVPEFSEKHRAAQGFKTHQICLEIHRSLFNFANGYSRNLDMALFWKHSRRMNLPGHGEIVVPGREAMLMYNAVHAVHHNYSRLMYATDIAYGCREWGRSLDTELLRSLAEAYDSFGALRRYLLYIDTEFQQETQLAEFAWSLPCSDSDSDVLPLTSRSIFQAMAIGIAAPSTVTLERIMHEEKPMDAIRTALSIIFPAPPTMTRYYGAKSPILLACLYVIRPFQLAGRHLRVLYLRWRLLSAS